jgi:hypothetical protein
VSRRLTVGWGAALLAVAVAGTGLVAQDQWGWRWRDREPRFPPERPTDRAFSMCRLMYDRVRREGGGQGWVTDYPWAEINFMTRLADLTKTHVSFDSAGRPNHYVVRPTDEALFTCPFVMASDVGTMGLGPDEAARLADYLAKGGFLWVDDFWGTYAWAHWEREIRKVLPADDYPILDLPPDDPIFATLYNLERVPQITSIQFWRRSGGTTTSERGPDSAEPHARAIRDAAGRIMVLMTHNTDIADAWEREGEDDDFFFAFAHDGYAMGFNVLLHAMTH